ncbi:hypothetical protein [Candidatus Methanodesulfokora washburnensis]|jgi:hypothetical protein|uniref:Uncharacterized protein n=1 Tax=Candidatus Methanodesulfokora washburnensis TaxID=2478471 RepID=A0A3R9QVR8_9CREN|nr:hypothetical protein [Candidatus Methanodesulfokores washburnensis]RSN73372.1 hypothetical protein D6D85_10670 [Candidatus Methanodesulfokores washburnensis]
MSAEIQRHILTLLGDIQDPTMRANIATTITLIVDAFTAGLADYEEARKDLIDTCEGVLAMTDPEAITPEGKQRIKERAEAIADSILKVAKLTMIRQSVMRRTAERTRMGRF